MKPKKQSSNWYIAATHYLTAGFVVPLIGSLILGFIVVTIPLELGSMILGIIMFLAGATLVYFGVVYSSSYINKTYIILNPQSIVNLSTTYIAIVTIVRFVIKNNASILADTNVILSVAQEVIILVVFYFASKKFIKAS